MLIVIIMLKLLINIFIYMVHFLIWQLCIEHDTQVNHYVILKNGLVIFSGECRLAAKRVRYNGLSIYQYKSSCHCVISAAAFHAEICISRQTPYQRSFTKTPCATSVFIEFNI